MPIPDLSAECVRLQASKQDLSITFPGGAELNVQVPSIGFPDPSEIAKQAMAQASAVLASLVPLFNILDVALALFATVKSIPEAIISLDPGKILESIPDLVKKVSKLLRLVPQLSVPFMILCLIDVLLAYLDGLSGQLRAVIDQEVRIQNAATRAAKLGSAELQVVVDCAKENLAAQMQDLAAGAAPVNRLIALVNIFSQLVGLPQIPDLSDLGSDAEAALAPLEEAVKTLKGIRSAIPV
jgi:hypothetical protein